MPADQTVSEPTVQGLIIDSLNRVETKVDAGFAAVATKLDTKADKSDISEIRGEIRAHHARISKLEETDRSRSVAETTERKANEVNREHEQLKRDRKQRRITILLSLWASLAMTLAIVLPVFHV